MRLRTAVSVLLAAISQPVIAQASLSPGEQLAKDAIVLVRFAEISNLGALDPECRGAAFVTYDVDAFIDREIATAFRRLAATERKPVAEVQQVLGTLRQVRTQVVDGQLAAPRSYAFLKQKAIKEAGRENACLALASRVSTVISETRTRIQSFRAP